MSASPSDLQAMLAATRQALRQKRTTVATECAAAILDATTNVDDLARVFNRAGECNLLIKLMWDRRDKVLRRFSAVATFMQLCDSSQNADAHLQELRTWLFDGAIPPVSFSFLDCLFRLNGKQKVRPKDIGHRRLLDLFLVKYRVADDLTFSEYLQALARRCEVPRYLVDLLYSRRICGDLDFPTWLRDFSTAQVLCHVLKEAPLAQLLLREAESRDWTFLKRFCAGADLANHVDMATAKLLFDRLDTSRGLVLCGFHGAFPFILTHLFGKFMPDHRPLTGDQLGGGDISQKRDNRRTAAFRAVKTLMEKKVLYLMPDGPSFDHATSEEIRIFDQPKRISFSPALFAYEARSDTGWLSVTFEAERLVPFYVPGPTRKSGETFAQFKDRWLSFYSAQIESVLSSNPKSIGLYASGWCSFGKEK